LGTRTDGVDVDWLSVFMILAGREIDDKEDVELEEGGHDEEESIKEEGNETDLLVQNVVVGCEDNVEEDETRDEHHGRVLQAQGINLDVGLDWVLGNEGGLDEPRQAEANQNVKSIRPNWIGEGHRSESYGKE